MSEKITYAVFLREARKPSATPFTYIYYPITYPLSYLLFKLGFSANGISLLSIIVSFLGAITIIYGYFISGVTLFLISYLLDFCDGNVARIHYKYLKLSRSEASGKRGYMYESLYANISYFLFFFSLGYYFYFTEGEKLIYFILPVFTVGIKIISRYMALYVSMLNNKGVSQKAVEKSADILFASRSFFNHIKFF